MIRSATPYGIHHDTANRHVHVAFVRAPKTRAVSAAAALPVKFATWKRTSEKPSSDARKSDFRPAVGECRRPRTVHPGRTRQKKGGGDATEMGNSPAIDSPDVLGRTQETEMYALEARRT